MQAPRSAPKNPVLTGELNRDPMFQGFIIWTSTVSRVVSDCRISVIITLNIYYAKCGFKQCLYQIIKL